MRTSPLAMHRRIEDEKSKITDEELFTSREYAAYLTDIAEATSNRYQRSVQVQTFWSAEPDAPTADTNNKLIRINTGNRITQQFPTRKLRAVSLLGLLGHEVGHLLFSSFKLLNTYSQALSGGRFYPDEPVPQTLQEQQNLDTIKEYFDTSDRAAIWAIHQISHSLVNILEDVYIEARMCDTFPGNFKTGILLNDYQMLEQSPSITQQIDRRYYPSSIIQNLILQYARCGDIFNPDGYQGEYLDVLYRCIPYIDDASYNDDARSRYNAANHMLLQLIPYLDDLIKDAQERIDNGDSLDSLSEIIEGQSCDPSGIPASQRGAVKAGNFKGNRGQLADDMYEIQQAYDHETGRLAPEKTDTLSEGTGGMLSWDKDYAGNGYHASAASDMQRILNSIATDRANQILEEELSAELQAEADSIRYGDIHCGYPACVHRMSYVSPELKEQYSKVAPPLLLISRRLQKSVSASLKDLREGAKLNGLLLGRRLSVRNLARNDGHYFYNNRLPDSPDIAIALLIDESGSMSSNDRITYARATAIIIHDFCNKLKIPLTVYGHSAHYGHDVDLYAYAEFDSVDGNDRYRLMDMSCHGCNRDGMPLRYVAERLMSRTEQVKLLILISDGQPNAEGYTGTAAEADLRGIKKEYERKGITLFAAAIGDDKDRLQHIYKDGFLDITDLEKLPKNIARLIIQHLKAVL